MNREEAKFHITHTTNWEEDEKVIDIIYDDFEARTCGSCKYHIELRNRITNEKVDACDISSYAPRDLNYGCNKWEAKDK